MGSLSEVRLLGLTDRSIMLLKVFMDFFSYRMLTRGLHFTHRQRRKFISSLFGLTFVASVITVSASALPCPANHNRFADGTLKDGDDARRARGVTIVEKKPRRWIEETNPKQ